MVAAFLIALAFAVVFAVGWMRVSGERNRLEREVSVLREPIEIVWGRDTPRKRRK